MRDYWCTIQGALRMIYAAILLLAAAIGTVFARLVSAPTGWITAAATIVLGFLASTKTALEVYEKFIDLRKKRKVETSRVIVPTDEQIGTFGGERYREIKRKARYAEGVPAKMALPRREILEPKRFIVSTTEQRTDSDHS